MEKLFSWLTHWGSDKLLHFCFCFIIAVIAACICKLSGGSKYSVLAMAWFAGFFAGVGKEVYDDWKSDCSDSADWAADVLGTFLGALVSFLFVC
jgi:VanZ family protein